MNPPRIETALEGALFLASIALAVGVTLFKRPARQVEPVAAPQTINLTRNGK